MAHLELLKLEETSCQKVFVISYIQPKMTIKPYTQTTSDTKRKRKVFWHTKNTVFNSCFEVKHNGTSKTAKIRRNILSRSFVITYVQPKMTVLCTHKLHQTQKLKENSFGIKGTLYLSHLLK